MKPVLATLTVDPYPGTSMPDAVAYAVALATVSRQDVRLLWHDHSIVVDADTSADDALRVLAHDVGAALPEPQTRPEYPVRRRLCLLPRLGKILARTLPRP